MPREKTKKFLKTLTSVLTGQGQYNDEIANHHHRIPVCVNITCLSCPCQFATGKYMSLKSLSACEQSNQL